MKNSHMRKIFLLMLIACTGTGAFGQFPGGQRGAGAQIPSIGHFYGKIVDAKSNKGIDGVSVQLVKSKFDTATKKVKDSAIAGTITQKGNFSFENLPIMGSYRLKI